MVLTGKSRKYTDDAKEKHQHRNTLARKSPEMQKMDSRRRPG
jgi:hypothetical protein